MTITLVTLELGPYSEINGIIEAVLIKCFNPLMFDQSTVSTVVSNVTVEHVNLKNNICKAMVLWVASLCKECNLQGNRFASNG